MLRSKCKLADSLWILLILAQASILSIKKNKREKRIRLIFGFVSANRLQSSQRKNFQNFFVDLQKFAKYCIWISRLVHLLTFAFSKIDEYFWTTNKDKILRECLPWALSLKRHVVVLKTTAKKCFKHHETCNHNYII